MNVKERIEAFNEENRPFYIVDHDDGKFSLCLPLGLISGEYEDFGQKAFDAYALEIGEPPVDSRGFQTHGNGYEWEAAFCQAFEGDPKLRRFAFDCESSGFFMDCDDLSLLEEYGSKFREICMDTERFTPIVSQGIKRMEQWLAEQEKLMSTVRGALLENPSSTFDIMTPDGNIRITPQDTKGYYCEVFDDPAYGNRVDDFCLAIGHEIADDSNEALDRGIREYLGLNQVMSEQRKTELLGNFIGWFLDHQTSDEGLFRDLHVEIGMTKDELHDFSIDSLDELFDRAEKEHQKEIEETADTITAEDLVEQAVYAANAPDFLTEEEQAEDMLGMLGANIMDEGLQTVDSQSLIASAVADLVIKQSIEDQTEGRYTLTADTLHKLSNGKMMAPTVIEDLLLDRKEIELIEGNWETDELYLYLASDYVRMEDESDLRVLSQEEVEAMCADHVLWLNDAGGKQADFSNCVIRGMDLSMKNLMNANFNGAKLAEVILYRTELNFSDCEGAKFYNCHGEGVYAEEVNFKDAVFRNSQMFGGTFTHSNFSNAQFNACDLCYASLQNCCLDGTDFGDSICDQMSKHGCSYDEEAWTAHAQTPNLKM